MYIDYNDPYNPLYDMTTDEMWDFDNEGTDDHMDVTDPGEPTIPEADEDEPERE